jgi:hypothetical protein
MTGNRVGVFFHGDRREFQQPRYTRTELAEWAARGNGFLPIEEISFREAKAELADWPEALEGLGRLNARYHDTDEEWEARSHTQLTEQDDARTLP